ncbi:hypothetical protein ACHAW6_011788 [Cyclotella cf. meneghiniana]
MKIFGKRKTTIKSAQSSVDIGTDVNTKADDLIEAALPSEIPSYFSSVDDTDVSKKKKQRTKQSNNEVINGEDMATLLAMDPEKLNSKQRRLVRRFKERDAAHDVCGDVLCEGGQSNPVDDTSEQHSDKKDSKEVVTAPRKSDESSSRSKDDKQLLSQLEGLNSKDRRKFLRQLRNDNQDGNNNNDESKSNHELIAKLEEEAKRIAERNVRESAEKQTTQPSKSNGREEDETPSKPLDQQQSTQSKKSKPKSKDLSNLPPEEIARREKQRQLQKEAAERRANGEVTNTHRHPLNSERRRANRRKPAHKKSGSKKGDFNSVGYRMRKGG